MYDNVAILWSTTIQNTGCTVDRRYKVHTMTAQKLDFYLLSLYLLTTYQPFASEQYGGMVLMVNDT